DLPRRIKVDLIILVDTQSLVTPKGMSSDTVVQIIDHHPLSRELSANWTFSGGQVGATTTLLLERIIAARLPLTPIEATLLALGIYEDTGSLTYPTTTVRDLRCATWLLEQGANLAVVSDFLHHPLTDRQLALYDALLSNAQALDFAGNTVVVASARTDNPVEEISALAHKIRDLYDPAGLFLLVDLTEYVQLVARSTSDAVDVGRIAQQLGGGGHSRAASALIRSATLDETRERLLDLLEQYVRPSVTVAQIMSHGVHTLSPQTTAEEAAEIMSKYGFEGFPVVANGQIVGILSRREIDRAIRLNLGSMPVSHYMTAGDIHVTPADSVERLQQAMTQFGVGQVPVVSDGQIVGVVTRTDLIKLWGRPAKPPPRREEITQKIKAALPTPLFNLLARASSLAQEMGYPLYVVGGFVRDLLLGAPTLDMDLVVEGGAIKLARRLARDIGAPTRSHKQFGTAKIILASREAEFGVPFLDFATARLEFYAYSAALPEVEGSSIKADLHRRDFTINTLAIRLDSGYYGELLDFYGGEQDLKDGLIRVLHSLSFIEDPTRILRAARFEQRLGFAIETRTAELIDNAMPMLSRVSGERIRHELYLILREQEPERALCRLDRLGVLAHIQPRLCCDEQIQALFVRLRQTMAEGLWDVPASAANGRPAPGLYLALLTARLKRCDLVALIDRLRIFHNDLKLLRQAIDLRDREADLDQPHLSNSAVYALLHQFSPAAVLVRWLCTDSERVRDRLWRYDKELRSIQTVVDGAYLMSLGLKPSPLFSRLLNAVRDARLDGEIHTTEEEKALIARLLSNSQ
ncbi:MAG: CBS domain-containing protein, partial [Anaerolineae bacterium]|nr:CBS domain-containing protein [Anaerolineae bacterium]